jgi:hypothetical protein
MKQFLCTGDTEAFADLERRARLGCILFQRQELPPACVPCHAKIGFEIDPLTGRADLLVDHDVSYFGLNENIQHWFKAGRLSFPNFAALRQWLQTELRADFETNLDCIVGPAQEPRVSRSESSALGPSQLGQRASTIKAMDPDFVLRVVRQFALSFGIVVTGIDEDVIGALGRLFMSQGQRTIEAVLNNYLGGSLAVASAHGYLRVFVANGPPVCLPLSKSKGKA